MTVDTNTILREFGSLMHQKELDEFGHPVLDPENQIIELKRFEIVQEILKEQINQHLTIKFQKQAQHKRFFGFDNTFESPRSSVFHFEKTATRIGIIFTPFFWDTENKGDLEFEKLTISKEHISNSDRNCIYTLLTTELPKRKHVIGDYTNFNHKSEIKRMLNAYADFNLGPAHVLNFGTKSFLSILGCKTTYETFAKDPQASLDRLISTYQQMEIAYQNFIKNFS